MTATLVLLAWSMCGAVIALTDRHDRSVVWLVAGVVFGPLWIAIRRDRPIADSLTLETVRVSRLVPRDRVVALPERQAA